MAKHKKTRREKKIADRRHTLYHLETNTPVVAVSVNKDEVKIDKTEPASKITTTSYAYVVNDIRKILLVTSAIIVAQIVLFFTFNRL